MTTKPIEPTLFDEAGLFAPGLRIAGVDEVGRGPLAGPVCAAAVVLDPARPIEGLADSKKLSQKRREALERFADLVEGNLLAAKQEVDKLGILFGPGELTSENIDACVSNSSRYGTDALVRSTLLGEPERVARIVDGLEAQAEPFPLILMMLTMQLRSVLRLSAAYARGQSFVKGVFATDELKRAARRLKPQRVAAALSVCADIDRISKGLPVPQRDSDPWIELKSVCLFLAR